MTAESGAGSDYRSGAHCRLIVHHHRARGEEEFRTSIVRSGIRRIEPPGLDLDVDAVYAASAI